MSDYSIKSTGFEDLKKDLIRLGLSLDDMRAPFAALASDAAGLAAGFAPHRTGRLASSVRGSKAKNYARVSAGGARVPYAGVQNYGWKARNIEPSHFMGRASDAIEPHIQPRIQRAIDKLIAERGWV